MVGAQQRGEELQSARSLSCVAVLALPASVCCSMPCLLGLTHGALLTVILPTALGMSGKLDLFSTKVEDVATTCAWLLALDGTNHGQPASAHWRLLKPQSTQAPFQFARPHPFYHLTHRQLPVRAHPAPAERPRDARAAGGAHVQAARGCPGAPAPALAAPCWLKPPPSFCPSGCSLLMLYVMVGGAPCACCCRKCY